MSSNDQVGLGAAVILWRRRWLAIGVAASMLAVLLPWGLQCESAREVLVRIPRVDRVPAATAAGITAEVRKVIAPAIGCPPNQTAAFGVEEVGGIVRSTQPIASDEDASASDERLVAVAASLDAVLAMRLAAEVERIATEIGSKANVTGCLLQAEALRLLARCDAIFMEIHGDRLFERFDISMNRLCDGTTKPVSDAGCGSQRRLVTSGRSRRRSVRSPERASKRGTRWAYAARRSCEWTTTARVVDSHARSIRSRSDAVDSTISTRVVIGRSRS